MEVIKRFGDKEFARDVSASVAGVLTEGAMTALGQPEVSHLNGNSLLPSRTEVAAGPVTSEKC